MTAASYALWYLAVIGAGVSVALQQVLNANLRTQIGSPWWAGFVSYFVGTLVMLCVALTSSAPRLPGALGKTNLSWLPWTGGLFGAIFIATAIFTVPRLGAATVFALIVVGQMLGSLAFDQFGLFGIPHHPVDVTRLIGAAFLVMGVAMIRM